MINIHPDDGGSDSSITSIHTNNSREISTRIHYAVSNVRHQSPSDKMPHPRRMETSRFKQCCLLHTTGL